QGIDEVELLLDAQRPQVAEAGPAGMERPEVENHVPVVGEREKKRHLAQRRAIADCSDRQGGNRDVEDIRRHDPEKAAQHEGAVLIGPSPRLIPTLYEIAGYDVAGD